jgi:excisionase family DNA binding protein
MERDRELYRIEEAASQLGVGRTFLRGLIAKGEIKTVKLGRATRIPATEIQRFVAKLTAAAR